MEDHESKSNCCIYRIASICMVSAGAIIITLYVKYSEDADGSN